MHAELSHDTAMVRHPDEVAAIVAQLKAKDPSEISWGYDVGVQIGPAFVLATQLKGVDRFLLAPDTYVIALDGRRISNPKKHAQVALDSRALAQDPVRCPIELWQIPAKPLGPSLWVWQPRQVASPGWNEVVVIGGITDGKKSLLRMVSDTDFESYPKLLENTGGQALWREAMCDASGRVDTFGRALQATIGAWAGTGLLKGVSAASIKALAASGIRAMTSQEIAQAVATIPEGHVVGPSAIATLVRKVGGDLGLAQAGPDDDLSIWGPRIQHGRHFAWGEGLSADELADYAALQENTGVGIGRATEVFASMMDPGNRANRELAQAVLAELAMGANRSQALSRAQARSSTVSPSRRPGV